MASVGYANSYFMKRVPDPPRWEKLRGDVPKVDVAIIGGGIVGMSAAIKLKEEGKKVAVIEALRIGTGVTSNSTAKLSCLHNLSFTKVVKDHGIQGGKIYADLNQHGIKVVAENEKKYNLGCDFEWRDNATWTRSSEYVSKIEEEFEVIQKLGLEAELTKEVKGLPFQVLSAVKVKKQAQFNPYKYCLGLAHKVNGDGSLVFEESRVIDISESSPHRIATKEGTIAADFIILATHLPILDRSGHFAFCKPSRSYCLAYRLKEKISQDMSISAESSPTISIRDSEDGQILIICGSSHKDGKPSFASHELHYQQMDKVARENFPVQELVARWSAHDYISTDQVHYIGRLHRGTRTMFTATGLKKWGLAAGAGSSEIFADMILGKENFWLQLFDATRYDVKHSALNLGKLSLEVGKDFVVDRIKDTAVSNHSYMLQNGEGGIVKHNGTVCAMYKYPDGKMVALSPVCTHLGCHVRWNDADLAWDCPCHGSRFSVEGEVLHGPAKKDLKRYEW